MRTLMAIIIACSVCWGGTPDPDSILKRGDANSDGTVDTSDAVYLNAYLFQGGEEPPCLNQADVNGDGMVDGSDSAFLLDWLWSGGDAPPTPGPFATECSTTPIYISCEQPGC